MSHVEGRRVTVDMARKKKKRSKSGVVDQLPSTDKNKSGTKAGGSFLSALAALSGTPTTQTINPSATASAPIGAALLVSAPTPVLQPVQVTPVVLTENDRRMKMLASMREGLTDQQIALKFDIDLASVIRVRRDFIKTSKMNDPRALFSKRLADVDEAFEEVKQRFFDDPGNEVYLKGMNDFAKTLRELVQSYNDLEDPKAIAEMIVKRALRPMMMGQLTPIIEAMSNMQLEMSSFLPEHTRAMVETSVISATRSMQESSRVEYNRAVNTLSTLFNVDLSDMRLSTASEVRSEKDSAG